MVPWPFVWRAQRTHIWLLRAKFEVKISHFQYVMCDIEHLSTRHGQKLMSRPLPWVEPGSAAGYPCRPPMLSRQTPPREEAAAEAGI